MPLARNPSVAPPQAVVSLVVVATQAPRLVALDRPATIPPVHLHLAPATPVVVSSVVPRTRRADLDLRQVEVSSEAVALAVDLVQAPPTTQPRTPSVVLLVDSGHRTPPTSPTTAPRARPSRPSAKRMAHLGMLLSSTRQSPSNSRTRTTLSKSCE